MHVLHTFEDLVHLSFHLGLWQWVLLSIDCVVKIAVHQLEDKG